MTWPYFNHNQFFNVRRPRTERKPVARSLGNFKGEWRGSPFWYSSCQPPWLKHGPKHLVPHVRGLWEAMVCTAKTWQVLLVRLRLQQSVSGNLRREHASFLRPSSMMTARYFLARETKKCMGSMLMEAWNGILQLGAMWIYHICAFIISCDCLHISTPGDEQNNAFLSHQAKENG